MDYVGLDPVVGLECADCRSIRRLHYSQLLKNVIEDIPLNCEACAVPLAHDWTTINVVQNIIRRRMSQAQQAEGTRAVPGFGRGR